MYFLTEYYEYYFYGVLILAISFIILLLCYIITFKNPYTEKKYMDMNVDLIHFQMHEIHFM